MGAFFSTDAGSVSKFIARVAQDMEASSSTTLFPGRYKEHVAYALNMVAQNSFTDPPAAIASVYLATRFEFYFRILSGELNGDGTWINPQGRSNVTAALNDSRLSRPRISSVSLAYKIMKLNQSRSAAQVFDQLDRNLFSTSQATASGTPITDIGDRIEYLRNAGGHGEWGDISADSTFYGLVTAIVFYNQVQ